MGYGGLEGLGRGEVRDVDERRITDDMLLRIATSYEPRLSNDLKTRLSERLCDEGLDAITGGSFFQERDMDDIYEHIRTSSSDHLGFYRGSIEACIYKRRLVEYGKTAAEIMAARKILAVMKYLQTLA